jgi:hypothetical protein
LHDPEPAGSRRLAKRCPGGLRIAGVSAGHLRRLAAFARQGLGKLGIAARQHLPHRGVVVATGDAFDVEPAVLAALHLVLVVDHARCLCRLARGVADVETFDAQGVRVGDVQVQRLDQRPRAFALRSPPPPAAAPTPVRPP